MRISSVHSPINFKRALTQEELKDYKKVLKEAKEITGQTGKSIFIMPSSCLPQAKEVNTGVGHIASPTAQKFFKFAHDYLGCNVVEDLPQGQVFPVRGFYCAYNSSALALGNHQVCAELLTSKEYENLLTTEEFQEIVKGNNIPDKDAFVNFKNVMDYDGTQNRVLEKAFNRFQNLDENSALKIKYKKFVAENEDWLNLYRRGEVSADFFKFKQFLADEHLRKGKEALNNMGIKYAGDCPIGFSKDEVNAFPKAFKQGHFIGLPQWGLPALDYDNILDEKSDAYKLLKRKVQLNAKRYDVIRFDVAWAYVTPAITPMGQKSIIEKNRKYMNDSLLNLIEKWVLEVKGNDYDLKNLIYEFDAGSNEFRAFDGGDLIKPLRNRVKVYGSTYMHNQNGDKWGYNNAFLSLGWSPDEFSIGVGNHDPQPLRQIANGVPEKIRIWDDSQKIFKTVEKSYKEDAISPLAEELKIEPQKLQNPVEFAKAKFAEPMMAKNNHYFYMDVFGREERFDLQGFNSTVHPEKNYAYKVPENFEKAYIASLKEGFGFNVMDSLEKVFRAKGYDKQYPKLFQKINKYKCILTDETPNNLPSKFLKVGLGLAGVCVVAGGMLYYISQKNKKTSVNNLENKDIVSLK